MPKGFNVPKLNCRNVAIELNIEDIANDEVIDLIELHHIEIRQPTSKRDLWAIQVYSDAICGGCSVISPVEFLAEVYVTNLNDYALSIGANMARVYHNSCLGDRRIRHNTIGHIFEPGGEPIPNQVIKLMKKYVTVAAIVPGEKVTLFNRLGA